MRDFPEWFIEFINQQLQDYENTNECFKGMSLVEIQIAYLKIWSVIEGFAKIIHILAEKRNFLRELEPEIKRVSSLRDQLEQFEKSVLEAIKFFKGSIVGDNPSEPQSISALKVDLKGKKIKKYSADKNIVFGVTLPNKKETDKNLKILSIKLSGFSDLLNSEQKSKFYTTRNKIAHEGAADVQIKTLKNERVVPVLAVAQKIKKYLTTEVVHHE